MLKKTIFAAVLVVLLAAMSTVVSAQDEEPPFDPDVEYTLTVPNFISSWPMEEINAAFMEKYPNVTIVPSSGFWDSHDEPAFLTRAANGEVDDVLAGGDEYPDTYGPRGIWIDLTEYLEADADLWFNDEVFLSSWIYENIDGATYSVPVLGNPMVLWYNVDLLEAAGLEAPPQTYDDPAYVDWTWDRFTEYAEALAEVTEYGVGIENNILIYWPLIHSNGGAIINEDLTDYTIDDPAVVETLEFMTSFTLNGVAPDPSGAQELGGIGSLFQNGNVAMWIAGAWNYGAYLEAMDAGEIRVAVAVLPHNGVMENNVICPAGRVGISSFVEEPAVAYEYIKFLATEAWEVVLPASETWAPSPWDNVFPRHDVWVDLIENDSVPQGSYGPNDADLSFLTTNHCNSENMLLNPPWYGPFLETRDVTISEMDLVFSGEQTVEEAVANINEQADLILTRWQRGQR